MRLKDIKVDSNNAVEGGNNIVDLCILYMSDNYFTP